MDSAEGAGRAKKAWEAYTKVVNRHVTPILAPAVKPAIDPMARQAVEDMVGFWVMWHLYGGFEGLEEFGMHKSTIWRKIARFRNMIGEHPDVYVFPGITVDPKAYWASETKKLGPPPKKKS